MFALFSKDGCDGQNGMLEASKDVNCGQFTLISCPCRVENTKHAEVKASIWDYGQQATWQLLAWPSSDYQIQRNAS